MLRGLVAKYLPRRFDQEGFASELLVELLESGAELSSKIVRLRCLSEMGKMNREQLALTTMALVKKSDHSGRFAEVEEELLKLPENAQRALYLIYWENASMGRLSKELGLRQEQVSELITRATDILRDRLKEKQ